MHFFYLLGEPTLAFVETEIKKLVAAISSAE